MSAEKMSFRTEVNQLLDLMIHSLYSHKEVSIRELISNASDAIDKARYSSLINPDAFEHAGEWKIRISADPTASTLTISDNGIGMTKDEAIDALGTIAHSGTKEFLKAVMQKDSKDHPELIGQFGVGFYSAFMIADRVTVISRKAGADKGLGIKWESSAEGTFTVEDISKETPGTDVILHMKKDEKDYLSEWQIRNVVRKYSDYIEYPIMLDVEREEESSINKGEKIKTRKDEQINTGKAIWLRDRTEITDAQYNEFYRHISHDYSDPMRIIHYRAEGTSEFRCLLYIPSQAPLDIFYKEYKTGPSLYVRKVQIMDHCEELIPPYLRFIKGVVDSSDLPLNVSREILQNNRQIGVIKNNITKKVLDTLTEIKTTENDKFLKFHSEFGRILKEGIHFDFTRREAITELLLFSSTAAKDRLRTIEEYLSDMKTDQTEIYFITGASVHEMEKSPYLEVFRDKGYEVLMLTDEIDDMLFSNLEYKGKKFKSVLKGDLKLETRADDAKSKEKFEKLIDLIKDVLKDDVKDVRISGRLKDSPCCLVGEEGDIDPRMEKLLKAMGQEVPIQKRVLEINPDHPLLEAMRNIFEKKSDEPVLKEYCSMLLDQALLLAGAKPKDPALFSGYISRLMIAGAEKQLLA